MKTNLIFFLARFNFGGAGNSVYRLTKSLNKKKYNISIICLNHCAYEKEFKKAQIKVFKINSNKVLFSIVKVQKIVNKIMINSNKTFFLSNINYTNVICSMFLKKKKNFKLIAIERTPLKELEIYFGIKDFFKKSIIKLLIYFFYKNFDKIICNSKYLGDYLKKKYGYNSFTIYPPSIIKNTTFKKKKISNNKIILTTICRLSKEKNITEIIYALNSLKIKNIYLNIVGDGKEKKKILSLINKLNLSKQIRLLGLKKNITKYLAKTDLYINSSLFEGFPNSVVEAIQHYIPVIASQSHGGINEILLNGKYGKIYSKGPDELAMYIKKFYINPNSFYNKINLSKKNSDKFNIDNHKKSFENLFKNF